MSNISKIKISGTSYDIKDENACKVVELTQAEYDALPTSAKTSNSLFVITDAEGVDLTNYYTKSETSGATQISTALASKQDTLVAGDNITISGNVISAEGGSSITIDPTLDSGSTNAVANSAITNGFNTYTLKRDNENGEVRYFYVSSPSQPYGGGGQMFFNFSINGRCPLTQSNRTNNYIDKFSLVETSAITTSVTSSSTDSQVPSAKAVYDALQEGGGGKAIEAGRGIAITTGETADTVSFNLPISAGTGTNSVIEGNTSNKASSSYSHAEGGYTTASGSFSHAEGNSTTANADYSHAEGGGTTASGVGSHAEGHNTNATNKSEHASGQYNVSNKASTTWGDSGNTLFSVGNGTISARHNAFEIRQNGDIYITKDGQDVKLQDQLGGSITVDAALNSSSRNPVENRVIYNKIDEVEQVTAAGLNALNDAFGGLKLMKISQTDYDNLQVKDQNTLYIVI